MVNKGGKPSSQWAKRLSGAYARVRRKARSCTSISTAIIAAKVSSPTAIVATIKWALNQGSATARGEINAPGNKMGKKAHNIAKTKTIKRKLAIGKYQLCSQ